MCSLHTSTQSAGNTFRCFILDKRSLLPHITFTISSTTDCNPGTLSLCPPLVFNDIFFLSRKIEGIHHSGHLEKFVWFLSVWIRTAVSCAAESTFPASRLIQKIFVVMTTPPFKSQAIWLVSNAYVYMMSDCFFRATETVHIILLFLLLYLFCHGFIFGC